MKMFILFTLLFSFAQQTPAFSPQKTKLLSELQNIYQVINSYKETDAGAHVIDFIFETKQIQTILKENSFCQKPENFKKSSDLQIGDLYERIALKGLKDYTKPLPKELPSVETIQKAAFSLIQVLTEKDIQICVSKTQPAYSDGQTDIFVKLNKELALVLSVGLPD